MSWVRTPHVPFERGLGVGLDLRYGCAHGFVRTSVPEGGSEDRLAPRVRSFLQQHREDFVYAFFSFQPKDRALLDPRDYFPIWDRLVEDVPEYASLALHHTQLNLGTVDQVTDRSRLLDFTNAMIDRYDLRWVNEDVGIWAIDGKPMPYPLPPILTCEGLAACAGHVESIQKALCSPLVLEFPGFSDGSSFVLGQLDAYDFFRDLAEWTHSPVTLDTGHLLSYRWLRGCRGASLYDELDRLPLANCFEIHLSGCQLAGGRFLDLHHGVLLSEQLELLRRLIAKCPNLKAITFEDPKVNADGSLPTKARGPFEELLVIANRWIENAECEDRYARA